jgi:hypothetical protein
VRKIIAAGVGGLCLVPALAFAASPAKNSAFQWCESKEKCSFGFETSKDGKKIKNIKAYNRCAQVPAPFPKIAVREGKFSKTGTVTDAIGQKLTYTIKGSFTTSKKAVGTYDIDRKGCSAKAQKFTAKRVGKAQPGA